MDLLPPYQPVNSLLAFGTFTLQEVLVMAQEPDTCHSWFVKRSWATGVTHDWNSQCLTQRRKLPFYLQTHNRGTNTEEIYPGYIGSRQLPPAIQSLISEQAHREASQRQTTDSFNWSQCPRHDTIWIQPMTWDGDSVSGIGGWSPTVDGWRADVHSHPPQTAAFDTVNY